MSNRVRIELSGVVQGVGFRPYVYSLATKLNLGGFVVNTAQGLVIELEGEQAPIDEFITALRDCPPPLAVVNGTKAQAVAPRGAAHFEIRASQNTLERTVLVSPDYATCEDCLRELRDPADRRFRYPFINCTNCGPRYTIIRDLPYDRARTTMAAFAMCADCRAEYEDPRNRRFHAEPTCCPVCGPRVWMAEPSGEELKLADAVAACTDLLGNGAIVAVKGLGGFHLACDAGSETAVAALRERKERAEKPFAIVAPDLEAARELVILSIEEERLLSSAARPIVLARKKAGHGLAESVAPKSPDFGVMLPYTPLHHLLMDEPCKALVMTSGNVTDEPIAHENDEALSRLAGIADGFLLHDRDIHIRADDSVMRTIAGKPAFLRRSRGYAPFPVRLPFGTEGSEVLAVGPELKDTVCVTRNGYAFVSHHIGDLMNAAAYRAFRQAADHLCNILEVTPTCVACDMHPDYLSTRYAEERGVPIARIQHHHAHAASVLAEHGRTDGVIGVSFDGLGWGEHHEVWGGEFLVCDLSDFERAGRIESMPLAGGDAATKRPERMAYAYLRAAFGDDAEALAKRLVPSLSDHTRAFLSDIMQQGVNCPLTSSVGRLFDAASALLGVCTVNTFEGQAAIELDGVAAAAADDEQCYHTRIETDSSGAFIAHTTDIIKGLVEDILNGTSTAACAARFHGSVARMAAETCVQIREKTGVSAAALSGGVFANALLTARLKKLLEAQAFEVLLNRMVPAGDGGVSLGQAAVAAWRLQCA